jgi:hypothetical protein
MPNYPMTTGATNASPLTLQFQEDRIDGIPLHIPPSAVVTSCTNRRIVTIQESVAGVRYAVLSPVAQGYVDQQGRLTSVSSGNNVALEGPIFRSVPGLQMSNQLMTNTLYYQLKDAVTP